MSTLRTCPRCHERTFEKLSTHSHCLCCNYSPDLLSQRKPAGDDLPIPPWAAKAVREMMSNYNHTVVEPIFVNQKFEKPKRKLA